VTDNATQESGDIEASVRGDVAAFTRLVELHQARVRAYVAGYVRNRMVVDDLCQDVFLHAFRTIRGFRREAPFSVWLLRIARSRTIDHLRVEVRRSAERGNLADAALCAWQMNAAEADADFLRDRDRELDQLLRCLEQLPAAAAEYVREHYLEGKRAVEIARRRSVRPGAVRMALLRVCEALRACIERQVRGEALS
jgi:RNA polymerase sigma-70 factor (ECF subfamily)